MEPTWINYIISFSQDKLFDVVRSNICKINLSCVTPPVLRATSSSHFFSAHLAIATPLLSSNLSYDWEV